MVQKHSIPALIIGSGAAGGMIARELARAKIKTVILEQGPLLDPQNVTRDPITVQYKNPVLADPNKHKLYFKTRSNDQQTRAIDPPWGVGVGGSTSIFTGSAIRLHPEEFKQRSIIGTISGADLMDWPLTYDELQPFYDRVEREIGVSGQLGSNPFAAPQSQAYPMPAYPRSSAGAVLEHAALRLGLHPFPTPKFINTKPYNGRNSCIYQGLCSGYVCDTNAKGSVLSTMIPEIIKSNSMTLKPGCKVRKIFLDKNGKADGVIYFDPQGKEKKIYADKIFLCANAIETIRILLLSAEQQHPKGLLNNNGLVGRYFMTHIVNEVYSLHPHFIGYYGNMLTRRCEDFYDHRESNDFVGGYSISERQNPLPFYFRPYFGSLWGEKLISTVRKYPNNVIMWNASGSCLPQAGNMVTLYNDKKDVWGLPSPMIHFDYHELDKNLIRSQNNTLSALANQSDAKKIWEFMQLKPDGIVTGFMGGTRMGTSPADSVVNTFGQAHEVKNLYIMGTSVFPTSGRDAPSETVFALALRLSHHLVK